MNTFFILLIIGISLSMDAFLLSLIYGTYGLLNKEKLFLSIIVGLFHFIMPLFGILFGNVISSYFVSGFNIVLGIIFGFIGVEMIISSVHNKDVKLLYSLLGFIMFAFSVSIDSFSCGIGIKVISNNYVGISTIFMLCSSIFTYIGLVLGNSLNKKFGKYATGFGGSLLVLLGVYYLLK